jgi:hypothetical protein
MGDFGRATSAVDRLIDRASTVTMEEAIDLFEARSTRTLISGADAERRALALAQRTARRAGREDEYRRAREDAAAAFRRAREGTVGPWLTVTGAVANAAGALVVRDMLETKDFTMLFGPWQQAIGSMTPVGPGHGVGSLGSGADTVRRPALPSSR